MSLFIYTTCTSIHKRASTEVKVCHSVKVLIGIITTYLIQVSIVKVKKTSVIRQCIRLSKREHKTKATTLHVYKPLLVTRHKVFIIILVLHLFML